MDLGLVLFTLFMLSLGVGYFVAAYYQKLTIEKGKIPVASSVVRLFAKPKLRPWGTSIARVTVYDDIMIAKFTPLYSQGLLHHRNDIVDYDTGISNFHSIFKFQADHKYRIGHIITKKSMISSSIDSPTHIVTINYVDIDNVTHTLTIKKPYILTESYKKLMLEIERFTKKS
jgi:hypothetical protein